MIDVRVSTNKKDVEDLLHNTLINHLGLNERILWLGSGGSNIDIAVNVAARIASHDLSKLSFSLVDERYGQIGHQDENWQQLINAGFALPNAKMYRPLTSDPIEETCRKFSDFISSQLNDVDFSIGLLGMGEDGHIAGIKPRSLSASSADYSAYYKWDDYKRFTITSTAIQKMDLLITQAIGEGKWPAVRQLLETECSIDDQPAQMLKLANESILYTDYKQEEKL